MPILTGVSIFCLARQHDANFTRIFGGASGNEGLGLFSICFDWQYISGGLSPLYFPLDSLISQGVGIIICVIIYCGVFYGNIWQSKELPFLSQVLFAAPANGANTAQWNQLAVIGPDNKIDPVKLEKVGLPLMAGTYVLNLITSNMMMTAGMVHLFLYNWVDIKGLFVAFAPSNLKRNLNPKAWVKSTKENEMEMKDHYDPHFKLMLAYKHCPDWWYGITLGLCIIVSLVICYESDSTLPWWGLFVAIIVAWVFLLFFGSMQALTGVPFIIQPIVQLLGGYIIPGNPVANMYFTLYVSCLA